MSSALPSASSVEPVGAGESEGHDLDLQDIGRVGTHYWLPYAIPFGGHFLLECACGCFGPFVLSVEEGQRVECGVALARRDGNARRAICGLAEAKRLPASGRHVG